MTCSVRAKSGTSFERVMRIRSAITPIKLFNNQTNPSIHPTVVSPLKLLQLKTKSKLKLLPATSAVKRISSVATVYQMTWSSRICDRILRGGSSVNAPGRGGRRRVRMVVEP